ncbi:MAG: serine/threonine-protein kinase [Chiayiivirga sp.]|jgi:tetratricopeptide (TPR) repeat protein/tRNA A-37 threonylcarbamoyl transferase component Bud32|uniref:serine/threonine-protein kinase n=1 Tax=Chiayiivirga sp. TaxID=2041042 RepID=UPI0025BEC8EE|nr:serine/threonine-protein kinase [Chiayiivirga sp.]MCI1711977.1 serine/threonine-protein kinase [Chiayiivirga sp.]MCI1729426.1 serine/threonine-protein kinase [Chiayiivirga sp.]
MSGPVSPASHLQLAELFERIAALPPAERELALAHCDASTRERLQRLLAADAQADDPMAQAIAHQAQELSQAKSTGARLGAYRVLRELGVGGMGAVLLAERADGQFAQQVAVKLIRGFPTADGQRRLRQERQILAQLDHPNIAHLIDGGEAEDGQPFVVMEFVDGLTLLDHIARARLDLRARLALFDKIAAAVQHAHERLVIHRDLKPGNVLVRADGEPKLLDFGVAKLVDLSAASDPRQTSTRVWTPGYASPEQQAGSVVTTASDVYALGIMLREMLTGERAPGQGGHLPPGFAALSLAADLRGILGKASAESARDRYATVEALRADLQRWRDGRPVQAAPDTAAYRLRKFIGRHRLGAALSLIALLAIAAFVWRLERERERALVAEGRATAALAAAERDAATARAALDFLTDAFGAAMPEHAMSSQVSVRDLLDHARAELDKRIAAETPLRQPIERLLGHLYHSLGEPRIAAELLASGLRGVEAKTRFDALALADDYDVYSGSLGMLERGADGLAAAQRAAELRRHFAPGDAEQELRALDQLGYGHYRNQEFDQAERDWSRALELAEALPTPPPDVVTNIYQAMGGMVGFRGDQVRALELADAGLAFARKHVPEASPLRINLMRIRGEALSALGRAPEAEATLREAIALQERTGGTRGSRLANLYNSLGVALNELGRYRESLDALGRSAELAAAASNAPVDSAIGWSNRAAVKESAGDYAGALADFEQAQVLAERGEPDPDALSRRMLDRNYARSLGLSGQHARAQERFMHLRQRARELDGEDSFEYAMTTWQLVVLAKYRRDPATGLALLDEARTRFAALVPAEHPVFAHAQRARAAFALMQGDLSLAESEQRAALAAFEAASVLPVDLAIARAELADIADRRGRRDEARRLIRQALPVLRDALLPTEVTRAAAEQVARRLGMSPGS